MRKRYPLLTLVAILSLLFFSGSFFVYKLSLSSGFKNFFGKFSPCGDLQFEISRLQTENESLKGELLIQKLTAGDVIPVYSSYPFNNRNEIAIAAGSNAGLTEGDVVVASNNILVGKIKKVAPEVSIVTTIFDPSFETAVRVGERASDALMKGGNKLTLTLIPQDVSIEEGEIIFTAGMEFPYGLEVGRVRDIGSAEGDVFKTASIEPGFEIKTLRNVRILP